MEQKDRDGGTWMASYPKSGNTWLRFLMDAYRRNGLLDINDTRDFCSDGSAVMVRAVSSMPLDSLGPEGQYLLRPAALQHFFSMQRAPVLCKTHFANIRPKGDAPHLIPKGVTKNAVYMVRDPRSVAVSASRFFHFSIDHMVDTMNFKDFTIGGGPEYGFSLVSSWSNHVASWIGEKEFPVHVVKYEDLVKDTAKELTEVLEFLGEDVDEKRVKKAVSAADIAKLRKAEDDGGFLESPPKGGGFFTGGGGTRWQDELAPKYIRQIEDEHGKLMRLLGYLDEELKMEAVS